MQLKKPSAPLRLDSQEASRLPCPSSSINGPVNSTESIMVVPKLLVQMLTASGIIPVNS